MSTEKIVAGRLLSFYNDPFLGDMLVFGGCITWSEMAEYVLVFCGVHLAPAPWSEVKSARPQDIWEMEHHLEDHPS